MKRVLFLFLLLIATPALGAKLMPLPLFQGITADGKGLVGGFVYAYEAGTTTPKSTYTDSTGGTTNAWPVTLDANGRAAVWLNGRYKLKVYDSAGVLTYEVDQLNADASGSDAAAIQKLEESFCTGTGGTDTYACDLDPDISDYVDGMLIRFRANAANTDAAAINVDTVGAKDIRKKFDAVLVTGDIKAGEIISVVYDATAGYFQLVGNGSVAGDTDTLDGQHGTYYLNASNLTGTVPNARMPFRLAWCAGDTLGNGVCKNGFPSTSFTRVSAGAYNVNFTSDANAHCMCTVDGGYGGDLSNSSINCWKSAAGKVSIRTFQNGSLTDLNYGLACFTNP